MRKFAAKFNFSSNKFLFLISSLVILLRLPSLFEPYWYGDEGIYLTLGEAVRQGLILYKDIYDNKPPLLYFLAAVSGNLFWFRFLLLLANLATVYIFSKLVKIFLENRPQLQKIATLLFAIFTTVPLLESNIANAEIFMILPIIAGVLLVFKEKPTKLTFFTAGVLFSLATLLKVPAAFDFAALIIFLTFFQSKKRFTLLSSPASSACWRDGLFFLLSGFLLPILLTTIYYWTQGALNYYLTAAFLQNIPYLSSWENSSPIFAPAKVSFRALTLVVLLTLLWWKRKKFTPSSLFISIWFLFALFAAALSGRPYPHYLIQVLPSTILLVASFFFFKHWAKIAPVFLLTILTSTIVYFHFWTYPIAAYYQNFVLFAAKQKTQEEYFQNFGEKVPQTYKLAKFLTTHTNSHEKVFIWGDSPMIYALSHRLPVSRFTASYHIIDFNGYKETMDALEKEEPRFIINLNDETRPFPQLQTLLNQKYFLFKKVNKAEIYYHFSKPY